MPKAAPTTTPTVISWSCRAGSPTTPIPMYANGFGRCTSAARAPSPRRRCVPRKLDAATHDAAARLEADVMGAKGWNALGAFDPAERSRALDLLGFDAQLVFSTFAPTQFASDDDLELLYGGTRAHNRAMVDFCSADRRLIPVGFVPLTDAERAIQAAREAIAMGCRAILVPSVPPRNNRRRTRTSGRCGRTSRRPASRSCCTSAAAAGRCDARGTRTASRRSPTSSAAERTCGPRTTWCSTIRRRRSSRAWRSTASSKSFPGSAAGASSRARCGS